MLSQRARRHPKSGSALATLAALALIAAGSAGEADADAAAESPPATRGSITSAAHSPSSPASRLGTSARLTVLDDHVLEIWRDRVTGELALHQEPEGPPDSTLREVVRVRGHTIVTTEEDELGIGRFTDRARLSRALWEIETVRVSLRRIEDALARGGQAAPEPAWLRQSRADQRQARYFTRTADFGHDAGALARAAGRPVAWLGSSAAEFPLHAAQLAKFEEAGDPRHVPFAVVAYARPSYPIFVLPFIPPGVGPPAVRVFSVPIRSAAGREILRGLRPSPRFGGEPVRVGSFGVDVRLGPLAVRIVAGRLAADRLPALIARLRLRSP